MSQVVATFDSITKMGSVTIDGKAISDVSCFNLYQRGDDMFELEICSRTMDRSTGLSTTIRVCAAKDGALVQSPLPANSEAALADIAKRFGIIKGT